MTLLAQRLQEGSGLMVDLPTCNDRVLYVKRISAKNRVSGKSIFFRFFRLAKVVHESGEREVVSSSVIDVAFVQHDSSVAGGALNLPIGGERRLFRFALGFNRQPKVVVNASSHVPDGRDPHSIHRALGGALVTDRVPFKCLRVFSPCKAYPNGVVRPEFILTFASHRVHDLATFQFRMVRCESAQKRQVGARQSFQLRVANLFESGFDFSLCVINFSSKLHRLARGP